MTSKFIKFVQTPAGLRNAAAVIAGCRAGGVGVINGELETDSRRITDEMALVSAKVSSPFGVRLDAVDDLLATALRNFAGKGLGWLIADARLFGSCDALFADLRRRGVQVLLAATTPDWPALASAQSVDGLMLKGHEAGGFVGESSSFVLLQKWRAQTDLPLYIHGGLTPQVAAACSAVGVSGGLFDSQLLLLEDLHSPPEFQALFANLSGNETVAVGDGECGEYFRVLVRPGHQAARAFVAAGESRGFEALRSLLTEAQYKRDWAQLRAGLLPVGQDLCFAATWRKQYKNLATLFAAVDTAIESSLRIAVEAKTVSAGAPLAEALGIDLPVVQGPMTRVSDCAGFAQAVAEAGGLPMVAFALLKGAPLEELLTDTARRLGKRPWGIGLLGFAPQALLDEQLEIALKFSPRYAIIAGGRPDQAVRLEQAGIPSFLHVPSANLIPLFLSEGARRFIFEGRECGGHIGPLSSFVLWSTMIDKLQSELAQNAGKIRGDEIQLVFAGGIHDAVSSAMVQTLVAPLVAQGVRIGILMGSAYLFTREIVASGAIVPRFQQEVIDCDRTVNLESGPGHASRCAYSLFAQEFFKTQKRMKQEGIPAEEARKVLDDLILGRLRVASKGLSRNADGKLETFDEARQRAEGMYMLGQVATLRAEVTDIATLHREVSDDAVALLAARLEQVRSEEPAESAAQPVDIAIVGIASLFPKASSPSEYWDNILEKVDAITEIPRHRWDFRLYFDADRTAKDKVYSKWGGFLDDLVFDPTQYGMPPSSVKSVDPMQLMALEVAQRTLVDAGYKDRAFNRERASIIVGASGGTGDVGSQYGLRSELPRFLGELPDEVAARLPEWTEDSFAGILNNVIAGRIANRLDFGGVNFTTDAACASSLAAIYQGISELIAKRSDIVIAGGVDTVQGPFGYLCFSKTQALSPRGRCASFDAAGDGIVISEGIAMIALKRLADAERDGDRIYAVIKGVGGSSDGKARGMTAPLPAGQLRAMRRAYAQAGFGPETVGLFEAHGTGTVAGDTAELESTTALVRERGGKPHQAVIGSVKTMIGHTKATAGVAGLIKAALSLHHQVLPPHRVDRPNATLMQADCPVWLVNDALPWLSGADPRRAAVSSFGFGGTNFHVVLEEYTREYRTWLRPATAQRWPAELFLWSAADREALAADVGRLREALDGTESVVLRDLAASLAARRQGGTETLAIVARDSADLKAKLAAAVARLSGGTEKLPAGVYYGSRAGAQDRGKLAVLFPGQGSQYPGMMRELALHFPTCAETLARANQVLEAEFEQRFGAGRALSHFIFPRAAYDADATQAAARELTQTDVAQPALGAVDVAMLRLMESFGLRPDLLAGHSFGEFVALHAAGAIGFESLMSLSAARGRFIVDAAKAAGAELGTMAAVSAPREQVDAAIKGIDGVVVANHNAPKQSILSGSRAAVKAATEKLAQAGASVSELPVAAAFHSALVMPAKEALAREIEVTPWQPTSIPVYSNTTAQPHGADVDSTKLLMAEHLVQPVEFVAEIEAMYRDGARIFVELGPKSVLSRLTDKILGDRPHLALAIDQESGLEGLLKLLGQLICAGVELDVQQLFVNRAKPLADPLELPRSPEIPRHAWLINGSGVRRAGEPVKQVGLTQESVLARVLPEIRPAPVPAEPPPAASPSLVSTQSAHTSIQASAPSFLRQPNSQNRRPNMSERDDRRPPPGAGESTAIAEYFATMRQFLETQERVMAMYMTGQASAQPAPRVLRAAAPAPRALPAASPLPEPRPTNGVSAHAAAVVRPVAETVPVPARVVAQPAVAQPAVAQPEAPKPVAPPAAPVAKKSAEADHITFDRAKLTELLLGIVEEKTGYPRDMVGLTQSLESDLGIDSIKRIELVGAMLQLLPEQQRAKLADSRSKLNTQASLEGMLEILSTVNGAAGATRPFDDAGARAEAEVGHLPRYLVIAREQGLDVDALRQLRSGRFVVTSDALGVAAAVEQRLIDQGCQVSLVPSLALVNEAELLAWLHGQGSEIAELAGVVHLAPLGSRSLDPKASVAEWRHELFLNEKSLFLLLKELHGRLADDAHVLSASALGGRFGRGRDDSAGLRLQGGSVGLLKSYSEERPTLRVKAVDLDPALPAESLAEILLDELSLVGGRQEIGYPAGRRTAFHSVPAQVEVSAARRAELNGLVVLATGGARGVTAEVLRELALPGNVLILTGRSPLPEAEPAEYLSLAAPEDLRRHLIAQVRSGASKLTPGQIGRKVQEILGAREMRANLEDFRQRGATVEYHAVDVTDEASLSALVFDLNARHGAISGVVHGAGIIEDKLVADKESASWSRVVETKVLGLLLLQKYLEPSALKFLAVFSSVAGRYGNSGQADYATANELMNRLCCQLRDLWQGRVNVTALCWGPWGPTSFGAGMVTAATEAKFAEKGVYLVSAPVGRRLFIDELRRESDSDVELVYGQGPWEEREAALGEVKLQARDETARRGALLGAAQVEAQPKGDQIVSLQLDAEHAYLSHHCVDGIPVLPAAAALELFAEAAASLWPGWKLVEVRDCRLLKGIDLKAPQRKLRITISPPPYGSSEGFEVNATLQSETGEKQLPLTHYRCILRFAQQLPESFQLSPQLPAEKKLTVAHAYGEWLFHGESFQVILQIDGLSASGARALVRASSPAEWMRRPAAHDRWLFDPALIDAAPQMAILWARAYRDETALPSRFGRVVRYRDVLPERMHMAFECIPTSDPNQIRANVYYLDSEGQVLMMIEDLECISSAALNRLSERPPRQPNEVASAAP